jgi:hypothetical protein
VSANGQDDTGSEQINLWRLAEELSIVEAALLLVNLDPSDYSGVESALKKPLGYLAARNSLISAVARRTIQSRFSYDHYQDEYQPIDPEKTYLDAESLFGWLKGKGFTTGFFFPASGSLQPYLDPTNERYAPKLAAAVKAWIEVGKQADGPRSPKQRLVKWLRENAAAYGMTDDDGKPMDSVIDALAKAANWNPEGGAPKSTPPISRPLSGDTGKAGQYPHARTAEPGAGSGKPEPEFDPFGDYDPDDLPF